MPDDKMCEGCDKAPATTFDSEGILLCEECRALPNEPEDHSVLVGDGERADRVSFPSPSTSLPQQEKREQILEEQ